MKISSPFLHDALTTDKLMLTVLAALLPGILAQFYFFGYGVLINIVLCSLFALSCEALVVYWRKRPIKTYLTDYSALLTGVLLGVALPPTLPVWMSFIAVFFAMVFAKQLFGGLGFNPFNPAMIGYVLLLISFPLEMTSWLPSKFLALQTPSFNDSLELIFLSKTSQGLTLNDFQQVVDGHTMATPLDLVRTGHTLGLMSSEILAKQGFSANHQAWFWVNLGYLLGGSFLLLTRCIRWHIPLACLSGILLTSAILYGFDSELYSSPVFHLTSGAVMLGAFFIATDPVSAATSPKGRIIYGLLIGFLIVIIRTFGGYPDAVAFAVLLLNLAVPTIDHYTKPVIYGHGKTVEQTND